MVVVAGGEVEVEAEDPTRFSRTKRLYISTGPERMGTVRRWTRGARCSIHSSQYRQDGSITKARVASFRGTDLLFEVGLCPLRPGHCNTALEFVRR